ncbi:unnamed protein product, partial [Adineta steineri]
SLPDFGKKCQQLIFFWRPQRAVHPQAFTVNRQNGNQTALVPLKRMAKKTPTATKPAETTLAATKPTAAKPTTTKPAETIQTTTEPAETIQTTTEPADIIQTTTDSTEIIQTTTEPAEAITPVTTILMTKSQIEMTPIDI